ncbi:DUF418 domain-containing protein [Actinacidiphila sp. bgisy167]|uniref:DUF418 domain-containing protein n=1 Tax=Actinacidiphila sp. bgisy167 TaxID=3413797 RepID=UPI003D716553
MTHASPVAAEAPAEVPAEFDKAAVARSPFRPAAAGRLIGVDLARGLAIAGMFAAHVGPDPSVGGPLGWVMELARGRSSALFALLAGFSLVLLTGRPEPRTGRAGRQAVGRVVIRAAVLIVLGSLLTDVGTSVDVILSYYGLAFLCVLPLYRLRARTLAVIAAVTALVLPQLLYVLRVAIDNGGWGDAVIAHDPLARLTGSDGFLQLLITGDYPVVTWVSFLIGGMAVARLDLRRPGVRAKVAVCGAGLAVLGYGGSWVALHLATGARAAISAAADGAPAGSAWWSDALSETYGNQVVDTPSWMLVAAPHSQTTFSILGNTGVALVVLGGCLAVAERARVRWVVAPVIAVGSISLTAYVGHIVAIGVLGVDDMPDSAALPVLLSFVAAAMVLALAWTRIFRRGPLEALMHAATIPARLIT